MANLCLENGVLMYSFSYPPRMLSIHCHKTSESSMTKFCFRCYAYNDPLTVNCTKLRDYKTCSECSSTNHNWRNCQSPAKMCINCHGNYRTMSNQIPIVRLIQQHQYEGVKSAFSSAVILVNHRTVPIPVNHVTKISFADVVKQSVQGHHHTKDNAIKGFMSIIYASLMCAGSQNIFQCSFDDLLQKNNLPSFSIGDCPQLLPISIAKLLLIPNLTVVMHPSLVIT